MPDLSHGFETRLLHDLVVACYWMAALGGGLWVVRYFVRLRRLAVQARDARAEARLTELVLELSSSPDPDPYVFDQLKKWERAILLRVFQALIDQTKGRDQTALINLMRRAGFIRRALSLLVHGAPRDRQAACGILGYFESKTAAGALQAALRDRDLGVRLTAARALLRKDQVASLRHLLTALRFSRDDPPIMMADVFDRLPASLHEEGASLLREDMPVEWKRMLLIALARNQAGAVYDAAATLRASPEPRLRSAAWVALRELGDPRAGDLVAAGLADPVTDVRITAAQCAGALGGPEALEKLRGLLADPDWWVRYHAATALLDAGPDGRRLLEQHCQTAPDDDVGLQVMRERHPEAGHAA
jgi:HEAT repeat protein